MRALRRLIWPLPALLAVIAAAPASAVAAAASGDATPAAIDATPPDNGLHYPLTRRQDLVEDHFGVKVTDPYRWLENDVRTDPAVRDWVGRENDLTRRYIDDLPGRDALKTRMQALFAHGRFTVPRKAGTRYFYGYNKGL